MTSSLRPARHRLRLAAAAALAAVILASGPAPADAHAGKKVANTAAIVDRRAGPPAHRVAWAVQKLYGGGTATNTASAQTRCDGCRATAIALQIVLVSQLKGALNVRNQATAVNVQCAVCAADAYAYQFVVASDAKVSLTGAGWTQLQALVTELAAAARSGAPPAEIEAQANAIAMRVLEVLQANLWIAAPRSSVPGLSQAVGAASPALPRSGVRVQMTRQVARS